MLSGDRFGNSKILIPETVQCVWFKHGGKLRGDSFHVAALDYVDDEDLEDEED